MNSHHTAAEGYFPKIRISLFGSFYRGYYILKELLAGSLASRFDVVGVATDDNTQPFTNPQKRVWQYPHTPEEKDMVKNLAIQAGIETYCGRVKTVEFYNIFERRWKPDICIMATFGQRIDSRLFTAPRFGFYNLHPCIDDSWPSKYAGCNPFQALIDDCCDYTVIAMHHVDDNFDTGELVAYSEKIYIPKNICVTDLHKLTSPISAKFAATELDSIVKTTMAA